MATSADQDDRDDEKDAGDEGDDEETRLAPGKAGAPAADEKKAAAGEHEEEEEDDAATLVHNPALKAAVKAADSAKADAPAEAEAPAKAAKAKAAAAGPKKAAAPVMRRRGPGAARAPAPQGGSLGKSMILFVIIVGGLAAGFAILGREEQQAPARPRWNVGQTVEVEITTVRNDAKDLACASTEEIGGKHCGFESADKAWSKGDTDEKKTFRPYTTTDHFQFVGAGLWSEPVMAADKMPPTRFSVKCKLKVEGTMKKLGVRWEQGAQWYPNGDWFAGALSDCKVNP